MTDAAYPADARIVIVGAGHAGGSAAAFLRQYGHEGPIVLIGDEAAIPYQRPPLSKAWLKGEADIEAVELRPASWYAGNRVDLRTETAVTAIDRGARMVTLNDGSALPYDALILATGSRARRLEIPGAGLPGVLSLRTFADAEALKAVLKPGARLAVVGGGYVGLEAAASARALGAEAVIIEREARCLARVACGPLSDFFQALHRSHGVNLELNAAVAGFEDAEGILTGVRLEDGRVIPCDIALVGVGGAANDELARAAGIPCENGVVVDHQARTGDPAVFAIGDVTRRPLPLYEDRAFRLESVPNALEQAKQAAAAITGRPPPPPETPWFWSDQYDVKLQIAGLPFEADDVVVRGDPAAGTFAVFHLKGDRLRAVEAVNAAPEFMMGKQLIARSTPVDRAKLADPAVSMKAVAQA
ncbi:MAG: NAD(P)/FAD-dependent oxidoreductase [Brevundimonas sp.]|uniref:NAD(P)/FAD-dependent oxidoreductase n=1 Tax=Brevundimonas sp. TaxID=1871086 RepID=UPI00391B5DB4